MAEVLKPRPGRTWLAQARRKIAKLEDGHRVIVRPAGVPLSTRGCFTPAQLDLVTLRFDFAGRELTAVVRIQRIAAIALLRALIDEPLGIIVGYGGTGSTASYRDCGLQAELYHRYLAGIGGKAASPGSSYHNRGLSIDAPTKGKGAAALRRHGFKDGVPGDPSHRTFAVYG